MRMQRTPTRVVEVSVLLGPSVGLQKLSSPRNASPALELLRGQKGWLAGLSPESLGSRRLPQEGGTP